MTLRVATAPTMEPISLAEAKAQLRIDGTDEDALIAHYISVAREYCEMVTRRSLVTQTLEYYLDDWANPIELPHPPLISVTSVVVTLQSGSTSTIATSVYGVFTVSKPGRIYLKPNQSWPGSALWPESPICITYVAGYAAGAIPLWAKQAVLMLVSHWNENREAFVVGQGFTATTVPMGVDNLLFPHRVW